MTTKPWKIKQGLDTFGDGKSLSFDLEGHEEVLNRLKAVSRNLGRDLNTVANQAATFAKGQIAKEISKEVNITQKVIKQYLRAKRPSSTRREIILKYDRRWSLKHFKPRQTNKGVSYRIRKGGKVQRIPGAFMGPRPGRVNVAWRGSVFVRVGADDAKVQEARKANRERGIRSPREKIRKVYGVSPWGVAVKNHMFKRIAKDTGREMLKLMKDRIRAIVQGFVK